MRGMMAVVAFIALTVVSWGVYGPVLHVGQAAMGEQPKEPGHKVLPSRWRPFLCVGLAYFGIAVVVPAAMLFSRGEAGHWSARGTILSLAAGMAGALGALGVILAFNFRGSPIYVMPLVFGCAPVVNTFVAMLLHKNYKEVGPFFLAGLILVVAGAVAVMVFKPTASGAQAISAMEVVLVGLSVALTVLSWGVYGPVLHMGQAAMGGSRLRPFTCVGLAYFLIAVMIPSAILAAVSEPGQWNVVGTTWSLAGGAAGAIGALGIILAFNFGGKPVYVMPLVFGGAPVVNTFLEMGKAAELTKISPLFYAGLILVGLGAVTVLVFAPKPSKKPARAPSPEKALAGTTE
jgi:hypothetical protein